MKLKAVLLVPVLTFIGCHTETLTKSEQIVHENKTYEQEDSYLNSSNYEDSKQNNPKLDSSYEVISENNYSVYFAYDSSDDDDSIIEPVTSGKLIWKDGCLLFQNSELKVPVFPSEKSKWDEINNVMTLDGVDIPLNKHFKAAGIEYRKPNFSNFKKVANPSCAENRKFELILGGVSF